MPLKLVRPMGVHITLWGAQSSRVPVLTMHTAASTGPLWGRALTLSLGWEHGVPEGVKALWEGASRGSVLERQCLLSGLRGKLSAHAVMGTWGTAERRGAMEAVRYRA